MAKRRARRTWLLVVIGIAALILVGGLVALRPNVKPLTWAIRTSAILGYLCVFVAALSSIYMRELVRWFGRPFVKTHHVVTVTGLVLITLHPLGVALNFGSLSVFVQGSTSLVDFFRWGGRWAWYLIGIASLIALFRLKLRNSWRYVHWLNYLAFFLASTHAALLGAEFQSTAMKVVPIVLSLVLVAVFVQKRLQRSRVGKRRK
jgi:DMSO/TMAO reductase YedYZ heme-binding membrane subunit